MGGYYKNVRPSHGRPRPTNVACPTPIAFKLSGNAATNLWGLVHSLAGKWPPKDWIYTGMQRLDRTHVYEYVGSFHGRPYGGNGGVGGVPPMGQPSSYAWRHPGEYRAPDHGFGIPMAPPTASGVYGGVPVMGHPSSYGWNNPMEYRFPVHGFGIPMTPQTARGVPTMGQPWSYASRNPADYVVPDFGYEFPDFGYEFPDFGYEFPEIGFGVHNTPLTTSGVHSSGEGPASTEQGAKQEPRKMEAMASGSRSRKRDVTKLLEGFTVIEKVREGGTSIGHKDKYYVHMETGKKLRSLKDVERFKTADSEKKARPIANATNIGQPLQQLMQQSSQEVARSSATGEAESATVGEGGSVEADSAAVGEGWSAEAESAAVGGGSAAGGIPPETFA